MNTIQLSYLLLNNAVLAAALGQAMGQGAAIVNGFGQLLFFGGLIGASVAAMGERHIGGIKTSLVISLVGGLAWLIVQSFFTAGGQDTGIQLGHIQ